MIGRKVNFIEDEMAFMKFTVNSPKHQFEVRNDLVNTINETITSRQIIKEMQPKVTCYCPCEVKSTHIATVWKKDKCSSKQNIIPHTPEIVLNLVGLGLSSLMMVCAVYLLYMCLLKCSIDNDEYLGDISTGMKETKYINIVQYSNFIVIIINVHVMLILYFILYVTASKPEKHVLLRLLSSVTAEWQEIGDLLGVEPDTIEELRISNFSNNVKYLRCYRAGWTKSLLQLHGTISLVS